MLWKRKLGDNFFVDKYAKPLETSISPAGEYRLVVESFPTLTHSWDYTRGKVYKGGVLLFEVRRNYSSFPFLWIDPHPNGHKYLVCGADYQGQTILELDTGKRQDFRSSGFERGHGFCWIDYEFEPETQILTVNGCVWACPEEYRFYDFSNPLGGFPRLETDNCVDSYPFAPPIHLKDGSGRIVCRHSRNSYRVDEKSDWSEQIGDDEPILNEITDGKFQEKDFLVGTTTLSRIDNKLAVVDSWMSEAEKKREEENKLSEEKWEREWAQYSTSDPVYLALLKVGSDPYFNPSKETWHGRTYDKWSPEFMGNEPTVSKRILDRKRFAADVEIARETGPIRVTIYQKKSWWRSSKTLVMYFSHSPEGVEAALKLVRTKCK